MKVLFILLTVTFFSFASEVYSQVNNISFRLKHVNLMEIFDQIEKQSHMHIAYDVSSINVGRRINISVESVSVEDALKKALENTNLSYRIIDPYIIISKNRNKVKTCISMQSNKIAIEKNKSVGGKVIDTNGNLLPGVAIAIEGTNRGVITDVNGTYSIDATPTDKLIFSFVGMERKVINVGNQKVINVQLKEKSEGLEDVSVVAYSTQRKVSVVGSIATVKPTDLNTGGVSSLSNLLAGRVAGLIGVQRSGEPGNDVSEFWIRGISTFGANSNALILIDGVDRGASSLNELSPEDIESFSVLKDATATAVYGARGANGVILINTKRGSEERMSINANVKTMIETLPRLPQYLGGIDYAKLANEARIVRGNTSVYSPEIFDIIKYHLDPDLYPDVNWQHEILKEQTTGAQANINISGGGKQARYYMSGFYRTNDAIYKQTGMERYHSNVRRNQYSFRSNVDVDATRSTLVSLLLSAKLVDQNRPGMGTTDQIWSAQANLTPLTVPVVYSNGQLPAYGKGENAS
ncbi:MAG: SusC/RagA family TonB-linked outer membrane protein, partial [Bacteroidota bacterium]|nr:SusC/RagA family TonB-linked outer membrane protein [Bacteroidota bacterium]